MPPAMTICHDGRVVPVPGGAYLHDSPTLAVDGVALTNALLSPPHPDAVTIHLAPGSERLAMVMTYLHGLPSQVREHTVIRPASLPEDVENVEKLAEFHQLPVELPVADWLKASKQAVPIDGGGTVVPWEQATAVRVLSREQIAAREALAAAVRNAREPGTAADRLDRTLADIARIQETFPAYSGRPANVPSSLLAAYVARYDVPEGGQKPVEASLPPRMEDVPAAIGGTASRVEPGELLDGLRAAPGSAALVTHRPLPESPSGVAWLIADEGDPFLLVPRENGLLEKVTADPADPILAGEHTRVVPIDTAGRPAALADLLVQPASPTAMTPTSPVAATPEATDARTAREVLLDVIDAQIEVGEAQVRAIDEVQRLPAVQAFDWAKAEVWQKGLQGQVDALRKTRELLSTGEVPEAELLHAMERIGAFSSASALAGDAVGDVLEHETVGSFVRTREDKVLHNVEKVVSGSKKVLGKLTELLMPSGAPAFATSGTKAAVEFAGSGALAALRSWQARAYEQEHSATRAFMEHDRKPETMASAAIERQKEAFKLAMAVAGIGGDLVPGWSMISGGVTTVFEGYLDERLKLAKAAMTAELDGPEADKSRWRRAADRAWDEFKTAIEDKVKDPETYDTIRKQVKEVDVLESTGLAVEVVVPTVLGALLELLPPSPATLVTGEDLRKMLVKSLHGRTMIRDHATPAPPRRNKGQRAYEGTHDDMRERDAAGHRLEQYHGQETLNHNVKGELIVTADFLGAKVRGRYVVASNAMIPIAPEPEAFDSWRDRALSKDRYDAVGEAGKSPTTVGGRWYQPWPDRFDYLFVDDEGGTHWARGADLTGGVLATRHNVLSELGEHADWLGTFDWEAPDRLAVDFTSRHADPAIDPLRRLQFAHGLAEKILARMRASQWSVPAAEALADLEVEVVSGGHHAPFGIGENAARPAERSAHTTTMLTEDVRRELGRLATNEERLDEVNAHLGSIFHAAERERTTDDDARRTYVSTSTAVGFEAGASALSDPAKASLTALLPEITAAAARGPVEVRVVRDQGVHGAEQVTTAMRHLLDQIPVDARSNVTVHVDRRANPADLNKVHVRIAPAPVTAETVPGDFLHDVNKVLKARARPISPARVVEAWSLYEQDRVGEFGRVSRVRSWASAPKSPGDASKLAEFVLSGQRGGLWGGMRSESPTAESPTVESPVVESPTQELPSTSRPAALPADPRAVLADTMAQQIAVGTDQIAAIAQVKGLPTVQALTRIKIGALEDGLRKRVDALTAARAALLADPVVRQESLEPAFAEVSAFSLASATFGREVGDVLEDQAVKAEIRTHEDTVSKNAQKVVGGVKKALGLLSTVLMPSGAPAVAASGTKAGLELAASGALKAFRSWQERNYLHEHSAALVFVSHDGDPRRMAQTAVMRQKEAFKLLMSVAGIGGELLPGWSIASGTITTVFEGYLDERIALMTDKVEAELAAEGGKPTWKRAVERAWTQFREAVEEKAKDIETYNSIREQLKDGAKPLELGSMGADVVVPAILGALLEILPPTPGHAVSGEDLRGMLVKSLHGRTMADDVAQRPAAVRNGGRDAIEPRPSFVPERDAFGHLIENYHGQETVKHGVAGEAVVTADFLGIKTRGRYVAATDTFVPERPMPDGYDSWFRRALSKDHYDAITEPGKSTAVAGRWYQPWPDRFDYLFVADDGETHWARGVNLTGGVGATRHDVQHEMQAHTDWLGTFTWEAPERLDVGFAEHEATATVDPLHKLRFARSLAQRIARAGSTAGLSVLVDAGGHANLLHLGENADRPRQRAESATTVLADAVRKQIGRLVPDQAAAARLQDQVDGIFRAVTRPRQHGDEAAARQAHATVATTVDPNSPKALDDLTARVTEAAARGPVELVVIRDREPHGAQEVTDAMKHVLAALPADDRRNVTVHVERRTEQTRHGLQVHIAPQPVTAENVPQDFLDSVNTVLREHGRPISAARVVEAWNHMDSDRIEEFGGEVPAHGWKVATRSRENARKVAGYVLSGQRDGLWGGTALSDSPVRAASPVPLSPVSELSLTETETPRTVRELLRDTVQAQIAVGTDQVRGIEQVRHLPAVQGLDWFKAAAYEQDLKARIHDLEQARAILDDPTASPERLSEVVERVTEFSRVSARTGDAVGHVLEHQARASHLRIRDDKVRENVEKVVSGSKKVLGKLTDLLMPTGAPALATSGTKAGVELAGSLVLKAFREWQDGVYQEEHSSARALYEHDAKPATMATAAVARQKEAFGLVMAVASIGGDLVPGWSMISESLTKVLEGYLDERIALMTKKVEAELAEGGGKPVWRRAADRAWKEFLDAVKEKAKDPELYDKVREQAAEPEVLELTGIAVDVVVPAVLGALLEVLPPTPGQAVTGEDLRHMLIKALDGRNRVKDARAPLLREEGKQKYEVRPDTLPARDRDGHPMSHFHGQATAAHGVPGESVVTADYFGVEVRGRYVESENAFVPERPETDGYESWRDRALSRNHFEVFTEPGKSPTKVAGRWYQPWADRFDYLFVDEAGHTHWARGVSPTGGIAAPLHDVHHEMLEHPDWLGAFSWKAPESLDVDFEKGSAEPAVDPLRQLQFTHALAAQIVDRVAGADPETPIGEVLDGFRLGVESGGHSAWVGEHPETLEKRGLNSKNRLVTALGSRVRTLAEAEEGLTGARIDETVGHLGKLVTLTTRERQGGADARRGHVTAVTPAPVRVPAPAVPDTVPATATALAAAEPQASGSGTRAESLPAPVAGAEWNNRTLSLGTWDSPMLTELRTRVEGLAAESRTPVIAVHAIGPGADGVMSELDTMLERFARVGTRPLVVVSSAPPERLKEIRGRSGAVLINREAAGFDAVWRVRDHADKAGEMADQPDQKLFGDAADAAARAPSTGRELPAALAGLLSQNTWADRQAYAEDNRPALRAPEVAEALAAPPAGEDATLVEAARVVLDVAARGEPDLERFVWDYLTPRTSAWDRGPLDDQLLERYAAGRMRTDMLAAADVLALARANGDPRAAANAKVFQAVLGILELSAEQAAGDLSSEAAALVVDCADPVDKYNWVRRLQDYEPAGGEWKAQLDILLGRLADCA